MLAGSRIKMLIALYRAMLNDEISEFYVCQITISNFGIILLFMQARKGNLKH